MTYTQKHILISHLCRSGAAWGQLSQPNVRIWIAKNAWAGSRASKSKKSKKKHKSIDGEEDREKRKKYFCIITRLDSTLTKMNAPILCCCWWITFCKTSRSVCVATSVRYVHNDGRTGFVMHYSFGPAFSPWNKNAAKAIKTNWIFFVSLSSIGYHLPSENPTTTTTTIYKLSHYKLSNLQIWNCTQLFAFAFMLASTITRHTYMAMLCCASNSLNKQQKTIYLWKWKMPNKSIKT